MMIRIHVHLKNDHWINEAVSYNDFFNICSRWMLLIRTTLQSYAVFSIVWAYAYHKHSTRATAKKENKRAIWVKEWQAQRRVKGEYNSLVAQLMLTNHHLGFIQMTDDTFQELLRKIKPYIDKNWTVMGDLTPVEDKLNLTLRFLAISDCYSRFGFVFFIYT